MRQRRGADPDQSGASLRLTAFSSSQPGWNALIPTFLASPQGAGITIDPAYGSSGELSQSILDGKPGDIVNFSDEPSVTRLVRAQKVTADWNSGPTAGSPFGSMVALLVRAGNPKNVHNWNDLLQPGLDIVTPDPALSGSGKWGLLAAYAVISNGNQDPDAGMEFLNALVLEHIKTAPATAREATDAFVHGTGDVLITTENTAIDTERTGEAVEEVTPPQTLKVDNMVAVVSDGSHVDQATKLNDYLYTPQAQRLWARAGFRPVDPTIAAEFATQFPTPQKMWTIADLGGWSEIDPQFFDSDNGSITKIFRQALQ